MIFCRQRAFTMAIIRNDEPGRLGNDDGGARVVLEYGREI
jgi:hypothetical protein